jgi:hypothetical protein
VTREKNAKPDTKLRSVKEREEEKEKRRWMQPCDELSISCAPVSDGQMFSLDSECKWQERKRKKIIFSAFDRLP